MLCCSVSIFAVDAVHWLCSARAGLSAGLTFVDCPACLGSFTSFADADAEVSCLFDDDTALASARHSRGASSSMVGGWDASAPAAPVLDRVSASAGADGGVLMQHSVARLFQQRSRAFVRIEATRDSVIAGECTKQ